VDQGTDRAIVKAVEWMRRHEEPVSEQMWEAIWAIAQTAKRASTRLKAFQEFTNRIDPLPKYQELGETTRPVQVVIGVTGAATVSVNGHAAPALDAGPPIRTDGLRLHRDGSNGQSE
jgi:hypothetical protein